MPQLEFENYQETSEKYDSTRIPVGVEVLLGCFASTPKPLSEQTLLDGGCGTGNYISALTNKIGQIHGLEYNSGMFSQVQGKFNGERNVHVTQGNLVSLPYESSTFDGMMCNQVLHHLVPETDTPDKFDTLQVMMREAYRVLKPQGVLVLNTCSHQQLIDGFWWADLIPNAIERVTKRYPSINRLTSIMQEAGFHCGGRVAPIDAVLQGEHYLDPTGPLKKSFRDGDSTWALATDEELKAAFERVHHMNADSSIAQYLAERESLRSQIGQTTFLYAYKPNPFN